MNAHDLTRAVAAAIATATKAGPLFADLETCCRVRRLGMNAMATTSDRPDDQAVRWSYLSM